MNKIAMALFFTIFFVGCASKSAKKIEGKDICNQTLSIVQSSKNKVSSDGFTILYDGLDGKTLEKLLQEALKNQKQVGCK